MSKDYTEKIRTLLNQSNQTVPYIFQRFYTILKKITLSLAQFKTQSNYQAKIFEQYALIYRSFKKYLKDQPYLLLNHSQKIEKQLKNLLNPLLIHLKSDPLSRKFLEYFMDKDINKKISSYIQQGQTIRKQISQKNQKIKVFGTHQLANIFWIKKFKTQYAVHLDNFWNAFLEFIEQITFFECFISISSKKSIVKKVDPQRKYFITSSNVSQLFYRLSEPQFLQKLADQTAKGIKSHNFISQDYLQLEFHPLKDSIFQTSLKSGQKFEISGQDTLISGQRNKTKHSPTIIFGSSIDADIKIKNKYISRKQFMIIEQDQTFSSNSVITNNNNNPSVYRNDFNNNNNNNFLDSYVHILPFSLVCLSSSNFTMISYERKQLIRVGMIFKVGDNTIQILKIQNCLKQIKDQSKQSSNTEIQSIDNNNNNDDEQDETLQYLPSKSTHEISDEKQLEYIFLNGPNKDKKGKLTKDNIIIPEINSLQRNKQGPQSQQQENAFQQQACQSILPTKPPQQLSQSVKQQQSQSQYPQSQSQSNIISYSLINNQYYLSSEIPFYIKTANQVINGQLSNKIHIEEGMKIWLEECYLCVK